MIPEEHARTLKLARVGLALYGFLLGAELILGALRSLGWRIVHDSPLMLYVAYWLGRGKAPYRDFFDINLPGTYLMNYVLGELAGYSNDLGFRVGDIVLLIGICLFAGLAMRAFHWSVFLFGPLCFGLWYLNEGPLMSFQREVLALLPISIAVMLVSLKPTRASYWILVFGIGSCAGWVALIKPHAAIVVPLVALQLVPAARDLDMKHPTLKTAVMGLGGVLVVFAAAGLYLYSKGSLGSLFDIARNYGPAYMNVNGEHQTVSGLERWKYLLTTWLTFGGHTLWVVGSVIGVWTVLRESDLSPRSRLQIKTLAMLAGFYCVYPAFTTRFFFYHWIPFVFFATLLTSLCFHVLSTRSDTVTKALVAGAAVLIIWVQIRPHAVIAHEIVRFRSPRVILDSSPQYNPRVDPAALFLKTYLQPGDTVQPLDVTYGAIHAMLIARAELATPFMYDSPFYHHVSRPYNGVLRKRFIDALRAAPPRYVLQVDHDVKHFVRGQDTSFEFPELERFLQERYAVYFEGLGYVIHGPPDAPPPSVDLDQVSRAKPDGSLWCDQGHYWVGSDGLDISLGRTRRAHIVDVSLDYNDSYDLHFYEGVDLIGTVRVPKATGLEGLRRREVSVPGEATRRGFDRIRVVPVDGDGLSSLGHLLLDP